MTTIIVSSGVTSSVSTPTPNTTAYLVEGTGVLDVLSGGTVSGPITVKAGGQVTVSSGGKVLSTVISSGGTEARFWYGKQHHHRQPRLSDHRGRWLCEQHVCRRGR